MKKRLTPNIFEVYGRLRVLFESVDRNHNWVCWCSCGNFYETHKENLRFGGTKSCGCLKREWGAIFGNHTAIHHLSNSPEFSSWDSMLKRCTNAKHRYYGDYGGRGITIYPIWRSSFAAFYAHMGPKPTPKHTLDRIDNNGNYEPGNCKWSTRKEQAANRRNTLTVKVNGEQVRLIELATQRGIPYRTLYNRLKYGNKPIEEALAVPIRRYRRRNP